MRQRKHLVDFQIGRLRLQGFDREELDANLVVLVCEDLTFGYDSGGALDFSKGADRLMLAGTARFRCFGG
ncbi:MULTISPECIES: hypothetical protein [Pseudomonas syringae group]|nr:MULTISPECIES: hypothetical protein [Pseudomonas syringae group]